MWRRGTWTWARGQWLRTSDKTRVLWLPNSSRLCYSGNPTLLNNNNSNNPIRICKWVLSTPLQSCSMLAQLHAMQIHRVLKSNCCLITPRRFHTDTSVFWRLIDWELRVVLLWVATYIEFMCKIYFMRAHANRSNSLEWTVAIFNGWCVIICSLIGQLAVATWLIVMLSWMNE